MFVASAAPPIRFCNVIDAEYVVYQTLDDLKRAVMDAALCKGFEGG